MQYYRVFREGDFGEEPILLYEEGEPRAKSGLRKCVFVEEETDRYRSRNDKFNTFITGNVNDNPKNPSSAVLNMDVLWTRYSAWCKVLQVQPSMEDLQDAMELRYDVMHESNGFRGWKKICLWSEAEMESRSKQSTQKAGGDSAEGASGYCSSQ